MHPDYDGISNGLKSFEFWMCSITYKYHLSLRIGFACSIFENSGLARGNNFNDG